MRAHVETKLFLYCDTVVLEARVRLTGDGPEIREPISQLHIDNYALYRQIEPSASVLEMECDVSRHPMKMKRWARP